jgi:uncharacterized repeat protein (TIGR01451 family)
MTVVEPDLVMDKSGPDTMTIGTPETFTLDLQNVGDGPAWNVTLTDLLPDTPNGGTCGTAPTAFTAEVFQSNGSTSVSGPLGQGSDFTVVYDGPSCLLTLQFLTPQTTIGSTERLIVTYDVQLDAGTQDGTSLTNYAGAVEWYSWEDTSPDRRTYTDTVTDGTPGDDDPQDLHTLDVTLPGLLFEKTVVNQDTGADPATTASPGDILVYTLRIENLSDVPVLDFSVVDDLGSQNPTIVYAPNTCMFLPLRLPQLFRTPSITSNHENWSPSRNVSVSPVICTTRLHKVCSRPTLSRSRCPVYGSATRNVWSRSWIPCTN